MIRVLIVDDHAIFRTGLRQVISEEADLEVVGEAGTAQEAIELARIPGQWDVMVLDIALPDRSGLDVLHRVKQSGARLPVLILSMYPEDQYAVRMLRAGVAGYLTKESAPDLLVEAIRKAARGGKYVSPEMAERLVDELDASRRKPLHTTLSDREFQVFRAIAMGKSSMEIARELFISVKTVGTYRTRLLRKMEMSKNAEIIRYALENDLLD
ncbi:MAG: response regulator transcription factor [Pseudomonadota bacterium]|jgi:DNA-binding NarL/FixJ family response regulator